MEKTGMEGSNAGAVSTGLDRISETAQQTMDRLTRAASIAADRLTDRSEELWALRGRAVDTARSYAREHPLATLGIAIAVGVLLSRLISRR